VKAIGTPGDHAHAVVDAFDNGVSVALTDIGQDPVLVGADGACQAHKGLELGSARPTEPVLERRARPLGLAIVERVGQSIVEQSRAK